MTDVKKLAERLDEIGVKPIYRNRLAKIVKEGRLSPENALAFVNTNVERLAASQPPAGPSIAPEQQAALAEMSGYNGRTSADALVEQNHAHAVANAGSEAEVLAALKAWPGALAEGGQTIGHHYKSDEGNA